MLILLLSPTPREVSSYHTAEVMLSTFPCSHAGPLDLNQQPTTERLYSLHKFLGLSTVFAMDCFFGVQK